jgi:hypothetical protein
MAEFQRTAADADAADDPFAGQVEQPAEQPSAEPAAKSSDRSLDDLLAQGAERAAEGIDALTAFLNGLTKFESRMIGADQRQAWLEAAGKAVGVAAQ